MNTLPTPLRVLHLEDNPLDGELIQAQIETEWPDAVLLRVDTREAFLQALEEFQPDLVISDYNVPGFDGRNALHIVRLLHPEVPVLMATGTLSDMEAVSLIKDGAKDYVLKDNLTRLNPAIRQALSMEQGIRARKAAEQALQHSEHELRTVIDFSPVAMVVTDADGRILRLNQRFTELFGYTLQDLPDVEHWWQLAYPDPAYRANLSQEWQRRAELATRTQTSPEPMEARVRCKDGSERHVRGSLTVVQHRHIVTLEDLTETKQAEQRMMRLGKLYAALNQCNEHIMRCDAKEVLFPLVCRDAVQIGGLTMAWIGLIDEASKMVYPAAQFGIGIDYLKGIQISVDGDSPYGRGPTGRALRDDWPFWCQDFQHDPVTESWHERGALYGWAASASIPLHQDGRVVGGLTVYADSMNFFDEAIRNLLQEMASNISFALDKFAQHAANAAQHQKLVSIQNELQTTLNAIPDLMFEVDVFGRIMQAHVPLDAWVPIPPQQAIGKTINEFLPPEAADICLAALQEAELQGRSFGKQYALTAIKEERWYELSIAKRPVESGQPSRFIVLAREITERKRDEMQRLKLLQAVEQSPNTIVITDLDANIEYANPAFSRATGYPLEEALGKNPRILQSGKTDRAAYNEMWSNLTQGKVWRGEFINKRKDGTEYIESVQISPVKQPDGRISNYLAIKEDITASKLMQDRILRNRYRMEALLKINAAGGSMPEKDFLKLGLEYAERLTSSQISFIHFVNSDGDSIELGAWSEATTAHYCTASYDAHYPVSQAGIWADCLRQGRAIIFNDYANASEKRGLPDGHAVLNRFMSIPVIEEGVVRVIIGVGNKEQDYTDDDLEVVQLIGNDLWRIIRRVRAEEALKQAFVEQRELNTRLAAARSQLLQSEKMASIGILAAGVAHEINNPIGYVNSNLGTLEKYLADIFLVMNKHDELCELLNPPNPEVAEMKQLKKDLNIDFIKGDIKSLLKESREGLERVKKIILDLKNFSRQESEENWQWADLHKGIESTLTIVWNELKYKCELIKEYDDLPQIYCMPSQLNQVFMNLLVNAAQAIHTRGTITIRTGHNHEHVWIEINDTGSGIPPDVLPRIFDPFFTTKPVGTGTGLGLPVSYGIIEKHHGKIDVKSEVGKGSTFRVTLPIRQPNIQEKN